VARVAEEQSESRNHHDLLRFTSRQGGEQMSELIVVGFKGQFTADEVLLDIFKLEQVHLIDLDDAAVAVRKKDGTIVLKHSNILVMADAAAGCGWGLLIGTVCLNPLMGTLVGGIIGATVGKITKVVEKIGIKNDFINELAETLTPDSSAIFILVRKGSPDKVAEEFGKFHGKLLRTSLSPESEAELRDILEKSVTLKKMD
jgi:uncharacterized membrane protein